MFNLNECKHLFEKRKLRRILGTKREEITVGCRKLRNEELHDLYCLRNIIRMMSYVAVEGLALLPRVREFCD
jgi:hypothetical protein